MTKQLRTKRSTGRNESSDLFVRANQQWDQGKLRSAFRLFLAAAEAGHSDAQVDLGFFYDTGLGVRANRDSAIYWYRRAYGRGSAEGAANIGTIWRDAGNLNRALSWFQRAVNLGNADANLEIAKIYLRDQQNIRKAEQYLKRTCTASPSRVTELSKDEAKQLLKQIRRRRRPKI
jgi:TPR repeat protein